MNRKNLFVTGPNIGRCRIQSNARCIIGMRDRHQLPSYSNAAGTALAKSNSRPRLLVTKLTPVKTTYSRPKSAAQLKPLDA
eukprot:6193089-Pleurochrysis_carterae.AAC.7